MYLSEGNTYKYVISPVPIDNIDLLYRIVERTEVKKYLVVLCM